jgi:Lrp/AsnC family transcriptional regulator for asnA, asnC and gidA
MDSKDLLILAALREDARMSFADMSKKTEIPSSTLFDRVRFLESRVIKRHVSLIDFEKLGFGTIVKMAVKVDRKDRESLGDFLLSTRNVNSVYRIDNEFDFFFEGIFRNMNELRRFREDLREKFKLEAESVFYIIEELKREDFLSSVERAKLAEGGN